MGFFTFLTSGNKTQIPQLPENFETTPSTPAVVEAVAVRMEGFCASAADADSYVASDEKEWLIYLSQALRTFRKPGVSLREEHQLWLAARAQSRALIAAASAKVVRSN